MTPLSQINNINIATLGVMPNETMIITFIIYSEVA